MYSSQINTLFSRQILGGCGGNQRTRVIKQLFVSLALQHLLTVVLNGTDESLGGLKHRFTTCPADPLKYNP
jgi:hypothetical protein